MIQICNKAQAFKWKPTFFIREILQLICQKQPSLSAYPVKPDYKYNLL